MKGFQKGHKHGVETQFKKDDPKCNRGGRGKGTPNKMTRERREKISEYVIENAPEFEKRHKKLNNIDYCNVYIKLLPFVIPKAPRLNDGDKDKGRTTIIFKARTERQLENIPEAKIIEDETNPN